LIPEQPEASRPEAPVSRGRPGAGRQPSAGPQLSTPRLLLRRWRGDDLAPFAAINADPAVMEHFPASLSRAESDALARRIEECFEQRGYGLWAVERIEDCALLGFVGLNPVPQELPFAPAVEVGWRLGRDFWGQGYASEAARAAIAFGFGALGLEQIVSFTTRENVRSRRLMERLEMSRDPAEDFEHPLLPPGHRLRPHALYRIGRADRVGGAGS
jgi:RimJ/RimL family protein N-acetyltransferase